MSAIAPHRPATRAAVRTRRVGRNPSDCLVARFACCSAIHSGCSPKHPGCVSNRRAVKALRNNASASLQTPRATPHKASGRLAWSFLALPCCRAGRTLRVLLAPAAGQSPMLCGISSFLRLGWSFASRTFPPPRGHPCPLVLSFGQHPASSVLPPAGRFGLLAHATRQDKKILCAIRPLHLCGVALERAREDRTSRRFIRREEENG